MINEIYPYKFDQSYKNINPNLNDYFICFKNNKILLRRNFNSFELPKFEKIVPARHIFDISEFKFFYVEYDDLYELDDSYEFAEPSQVRELKDKIMAFAGMCGKHYNYFFNHARYCGCYGERMVPSLSEMANVCPKCSNVKYPDIMPATITAITYNGKLLLTRYAGGSYKRYALVAGFVEIGETAEECVKREAMEEVGLELYDIKPYKTQPWGFGNNLMLAYTAKAKSDKIVLDNNELKEAVWMSPDEIPAFDNTPSVGNELINGFKFKKWQ